MVNCILTLALMAGSLLMSKARQAVLNGGLSKKVGVTIIGKQHDSGVWAVTPDIFIDEVSGMHF